MGRTDGAARGERSLLRLSRVATEVDEVMFGEERIFFGSFLFEKKMNIIGLIRGTPLFPRFVGSILGLEDAGINFSPYHTVYNPYIALDDLNYLGRYIFLDIIRNGESIHKPKHPDNESPSF